MILDNIVILVEPKLILPSEEAGTLHSIPALYLTCLGNYKTPETRKLAVKLTNVLTKHDRIEDLLNVLLIYKYFDFEKYTFCDKYEKRKMMLEILHDGFVSTAKNKDWDIQPLNSAYQCCVAKNLEHTWLREDRYILSPDKKYYAGIFCNWDSYIFEVFVVFLNKDKKEIKREKLYESDPSFVEPIGKMQWDKESDLTFILFSKDGKQKWGAKLY